MPLKAVSFGKRHADPAAANGEPDHIEGERSIPSVNKGLTLQARITNFLIFGFVILLAGFLLFKYYANLYHKKKEAETAAKLDAKTQTVSVLPPLPAPPAPAPEPPAPATNAPPPPPAPAATAPAATARSADPNGKPVLSPAEQLLKRQQSSPVKFKLEGGTAPPAVAAAATPSGTTAPSSAATPATMPVAAGMPAVAATSAPGITDAGPAAPAPVAPAVGGNPLADRLGGTSTPGARAALLPDRNFMLAKASHIECTMPEALDSTLPGMVSCVQSRDIYSDNGAVLLLERGTVYTGEMKHGLVQGQRRVFLLWTRAKTPHGVVIDLASPGADELGRTGVAGEIDSHFWDRFGSAIMLSLIDDIGAAFVARQQRTNGNDNTVIGFPATVQGTRDVIAEVIKQTAQIPPTLRRHQGGGVNIYVARDLDFRTVYALQRVRP